MAVMFTSEFSIPSDSLEHFNTFSLKLNFKRQTLKIYDEGLSLLQDQVSELGKLALDFTWRFHNLLVSSSLVKTELILPLGNRAWIPQLVAGFLSYLSISPCLSKILREVFAPHLDF